MTTNRPLKVFLCHSSADKPAVRELYQKLRAEPWIEPWLDEEELFPGMDWNLEIEKAIEATDVILVCLSNNSITKEGYVQREIRIALDYADYKPEGALFIIPVRFEECKPPKRLLRWQYADYFEDQRERALERLVSSLRQHAESIDFTSEKPLSKEVKSDIKVLKPNQFGFPTINRGRAIDYSTVKKDKPNSIVKENKPKPIRSEKFFYPNRFGLIILKSLEEIMGNKTLISILSLAGLKHYGENYPPDDLNKGFGFGEISAISSAIEEFYGPRGGRGFSLRLGRITFVETLKNYEALTSVKDSVFVTEPLNTKLKIGLLNFAKVFTELSDQKNIVEETDTDFVWTIYDCPWCWNRFELDRPVCIIFTGLLQECLRWMSDGQEFRVSETKCIAAGSQVCEFVISKNPIN